MGHIYGTGFAVGLPQLTGLEFRPDKPFSACKLCGAVYQSNADRDLPSSTPHQPHQANTLESYEVWAAENQRRRWSHNHAKTHTALEHRQLALSGRWCTPEAALKLAAFGVMAVSDAVINNEFAAALLESKPVPDNDVEGT